MHEIKKKLMEEIYKIEDSMKKSPNSVSSGQLEHLHTLTDTVKNICKIEKLEDDGEYSEATDFMGEGRMYGSSYEGTSSYRRGRGANAKRDSMGRYSRDGGTSHNSYSEDGGTSHMADGRMSERRYSRNGHYSNADAKEDMMNKAEEMLKMAENEKQRRTIEHFMQQIEQV